MPAASSNDAGIDPDRLYTTPEAAQILRLADRTLERMRGQGDGPPYVKLGQGLRSRVVYRGADLITWIEGQVRNSTSEPQP
ncbi:MAG: helix-turn-helix domain-containing protein [Cyanobacteria bacterium J06648_11]